MDYRTLLVHVDATAEGRARLVNALDLAARMGASVIGVGAAAFEPHVERTRGIFEDTLRTWVDERIEEAAEVFRELAGPVQGATWQSQVQRPSHALTDLACGADLIFASRRGETTAPEIFARPDDLVLAAGVPVLLQPPMAKPLVADRIVLGWKNTREARRAVWDSLPMLKSAQEVHVIRFVRDMGDADDGLGRVEERLRRHGVKVRATRRPRTHGAVADDLVKAAEELDAGLIVAGAYGQSRLRELVLGGVTRGLMADSPRYVLFSH